MNIHFYGMNSYFFQNPGTYNLILNNNNSYVQYEENPRRNVEDKLSSLISNSLLSRSIMQYFKFEELARFRLINKIFSKAASTEINRRRIIPVFLSNICTFETNIGKGQYGIVFPLQISLIPSSSIGIDDSENLATLDSLVQCNKILLKSLTVLRGVQYNESTFQLILQTYGPDLMQVKIPFENVNAILTLNNIQSLEINEDNKSSFPLSAHKSCLETIAQTIFQNQSTLVSFTLHLTTNSTQAIPGIISEMLGNCINMKRVKTNFVFQYWLPLAQFTKLTSLSIGMLETNEEVQEIQKYLRAVSKSLVHLSFGFALSFAPQNFNWPIMPNLRVLRVNCYPSKLSDFSPEKFPCLIEIQILDFMSTQTNREWLINPNTRVKKISTTGPFVRRQGINELKSVAVDRMFPSVMEIEFIDLRDRKYLLSVISAFRTVSSLIINFEAKFSDVRENIFGGDGQSGIASLRHLKRLKINYTHATMASGFIWPLFSKSLKNFTMLEELTMNSVRYFDIKQTICLIPTLRVLSLSKSSLTAFPVKKGKNPFIVLNNCIVAETPEILRYSNFILNFYKTEII